ncbi:uncharacterized protein LOC123920879 [Trifolium pratense]|uniref:uncharacterized protein LOC123920879 n=1 Tax=Trifolium pratense TaxID=57577 RepID=UPI001E693726|nr:uncharacterized protein LOC123920879 [Trifolium pratense]
MLDFQNAAVVNNPIDDNVANHDDGDLNPAIVFNAGDDNQQANAQLIIGDAVNNDERNAQIILVEAVINDDPNAQLIAGDAVNNDEPNAQIILGEAVINDDPNAQLIAGDAVNNDEPNAQIIPGEAGINDDPNAQISADAQIIPALANVDLAVNDHGQIVHGNVVNNHVNNLGPIANVVPPNRPNQWTENEDQMLLTAVDQYEHIAVLTVRFEMIKNDPVSFDEKAE